jgi:hypothetical protein
MKLDVEEVSASQVKHAQAQQLKVFVEKPQKVEKTVVD